MEQAYVAENFEYGEGVVGVNTLMWCCALSMEKLQTVPSLLREG
jgi:hypothetical protein